jgi:hypothetical protein
MIDVVVRDHLNRCSETVTIKQLSYSGNYIMTVTKLTQAESGTIEKLVITNQEEILKYLHNLNPDRKEDL